MNYGFGALGASGRAGDGVGEFAQFAAPAPSTRVRKTGLAVVHEGEFIVSTPESAAAVGLLAEDARVVHYHFPVEIEVVGDADPRRDEALIREVFTRLRVALAARHSSI